MIFSGQLLLKFTEATKVGNHSQHCHHLEADHLLMLPTKFSVWVKLGGLYEGPIIFDPNTTPMIVLFAADALVLELSWVFVEQ